MCTCRVPVLHAFYRIDALHHERSFFLNKTVCWMRHCVAKWVKSLIGKKKNSLQKLENRHNICEGID